MATTSNQVKINIDDKEIILTGEALDAFEADRAAEHARQLAKEKALIAALEANAAAKQALLDRFGITADEARLLLS